MAELSKLIQNFSDFGGLDLRSHDVDRKPRFARSVRNVTLLDNNSFGPRLGQKAIAFSGGGGGTKNYIRINSDKSISEEMVGIESGLSRLTEVTLSIAYSGSSENPAFSLISIQNTDSNYSFHAFLYIGDSELLGLDLGVGIDEASPVTVADLVTAINLVSNFTAVAVGDGTTPAASLDTVISFGLSASSTQVTQASAWEQIYCPTSTPFSDFWANVNTDVFENACLFNHNNLLYLATGFNKLYKYDGVSTYAAGMPSAEDFNASSSGVGVLTGTYRYFITYDFFDATGNNVEGDESNEITLSLAANQVDCTIPTIRPTSEFLTSFAYANNGGTQSGTTLTVDDGAGGNHTLQLGQTAFFRDNAGTLQEREITARTGTTITIEGSSVTIANNAAISANLRINLWRNKAGDFNKYLVRVFANRPDVANFTYTDNIADANLGERYSTPVTGHGLPPENLKYLTVFQNILVGSDGDPSQFRICDLDGPEYWNEGFDFVLLRSKSNKPVTALGANREALAIFKSSETHVLQGDLGGGDFKLEMAADAIGCDAYATVQDVDNSLWFYSANNGVQRLVSNRKPDELSYRILPTFRALPPGLEQRFVHKRAVAIDFALRQQYLLFLPCETEEVSGLSSNLSSAVFMADYRAQDEEDNDYDKEGRLIASRPKIRWWLWDGMNMSAGADIYQNQLFFGMRRYSAILAAFQNVLCKQPSTNDENDYTDFAGSYELEYEGGWDDLGEPDLLKKFISMSIYSFDLNSASSLNIIVSSEIDFRNDITHSRKDLSSENTGSSTDGYGDGPWGDFPWGEEVENRRLFPLKLTTARSIKPRFNATIWKERPVISGWVVEAVPAFRPKQIK